ncbi:hypothetical protein F5Y16DRAFT_373433 [Xylariaceae sp. FL0255]|nr:hypothetical protein F5Y16DRAFT_373433 [Xylariaceae sp. FL0255]
MPPRIPTQKVSRSVILKSKPPSTCFFCSLSINPTQHRPARQPRRKTPTLRRFETTATTPHQGLDTRKELESVLSDLEKHAANYVNLSRLQLALNGLRQKPGEESIRIAILGLNSESESSKTAKDVLRLLLADPLKDVEPWEEEIESHSLAQPLIVRVGGTKNSETQPAISITKGNLLPEIHVSSPTFNNHNLEILLADTSPFLPDPQHGAIDGVEDAILVPAVDIPTSTGGQLTSITTPVHKALVIADGILGAASIVSMPNLESADVLKYAVNLPRYKPSPTEALPFTPIDTNTAKIGLHLVRNSLSKAIEYERLWFQSNLPKLSNWLKADNLTSSDNATKPSVRALIASLLRNAASALETEEIEQIGGSISPVAAAALQKSLEDWAESAHSELQTQLDYAFSSRRWRKLGWWKLFWRVDDVGMLTTDILSQRFLPSAERTSVFLAGRMNEAGVSLSSPQVPGRSRGSDPQSNILRNAMSWPTQIPAARNYLQAETVPALQALAQKLVLQTLSTSGLTTALGALVYVGTLSTTLYEAGAVAALGIVWSMKRMQKQWEAAREFWEGEVREEGRKAVKSAEEAMSSALNKEKTQARDNDAVLPADDRTKARELVAKGQELLEKLP